MCRQGSDMLWQGLWTGILSSQYTISRLSSIAGALGAALWLTMLPDAGTRGRFCADICLSGLCRSAQRPAHVSGLQLHAKPFSSFNVLKPRLRPCVHTASLRSETPKIRRLRPSAKLEPLPPVGAHLAQRDVGQQTARWEHEPSEWRSGLSAKPPVIEWKRPQLNWRFARLWPAAGGKVDSRHPGTAAGHAAGRGPEAESVRSRIARAGVGRARGGRALRGSVRVDSGAELV